MALRGLVQPGGRGRPPLAPDQRKTKEDKSAYEKKRVEDHRATLTEEELQAERDVKAKRDRKRRVEKAKSEGRTLRVYRKRGQSVAATINVL